ncbi:response regulator [Flavobacteriaceae bacterium R38]|nr:response regulator [Flavobacteriaceae bacterium R38]
MKDSFNDLIRRTHYHKNKAKYKTAFTTLDQASKIADTLDNDNYRIECNNLFAQIYLDIKEYDEAEFYLDLSEHYLSYNEYDYGNVTSKGLKASFLAEKRHYYEAIQVIRSAREALNRKDKNLLNYLSYFESIVYYKRNSLDEAKAILEKIGSLEHPHEKNYLNAKILTLRSSIYFKESDYEKASATAIEALNIANAIDFPILKMENNKMLTDIYELTGDYKKAFYHFKEAEKIEAALSDPRVIEERNAYLKEQKDNFEKRLIIQLTNDVQEGNQQVNMSKLTSVLSSALLIIISLLTISLYRNNQIKFKTNDLLLKKNLELENARDEAERAMQAKAQFLSTVSHELRTPLYAVTGLTHLLLEENPSDSQKEHLKSLKFSGEYLLNFINDILQINKIEAKKLSVQKIPFNLKKVLKDVVDSLHQTAKENNNTIELTLSKKLPVELIGDPLKLSQILINLIGNACKFTEKGAINVIAEIVSKERDKVAICFKVKDNGIGISKELQATIFESFAQGSIQINRKYGGTGLGLTIVKSLLSLFDSEIRLESEIGKGSTFMFDIDFEITKKEETLTSETVVEVEDSFFENMHLLVVEDNKINQVITKKMLVKKGMTCDIANDGYEAIENAKNNTYNAILMDIHMPGISGLVTTKEIRKFNDKIPIIALTAMSLDENTDDLFEAGCNDVITKPFKPEIFYEKIGNNILKNIEVNI